MPKISILTVTYGNRFKYLKQVIAACLDDKNFDELIIVDNASENQREIEIEISKYEDKKIKYIRLEQNTGSAGGFSAGMEYFLTTENDYLLLLDDDNVPENGFLRYYLNALSFFDKPEDIILVGNRNKIEGYEKRFKTKLVLDKNAFIGVNVFSRNKLSSFSPIYISEVFGYGGSFIPKKAISVSGFPNKDFFVYSDDIEYSYRIHRNGFSIYNLYRPYIQDIDLHNKDRGILSIFSPEVEKFRIKRSFYNDARFLSLIGANFFIYFLNFFLYIFYILLLLIKCKKLNKQNLSKIFLIIKYSFKGVLNKKYQ